MSFYFRKWISAAAERLSGDEPPSIIGKWLGGIIIPIIPLTLGVICCLTQHGFIIGRGGRLELSGTSAVSLGAALIGMAIFLNGRYFFSKSQKYFVISQIEKFIGSLLAVGGIFFLLWKFFANM